MLERVITKREAVSFVTLLDTELVCYKHYICWADEIILSENKPPFWILDLAVTRSKEAAIDCLNTYAYSEPFERFDAEKCNDEFVAAQWLRYEMNKISWAEFLLECGDYTDGNYAREDCEYFYYMLNDIENSKYPKRLEKKQSSQVLKRFSDIIHEINDKYHEFLPYLEKFKKTYGV
ncbi:hypothetical protein [Pseudoalteromonas umbrosa]|uniref:hypothetical protein n=1 Tax=Pseudoalteromonas umbrosa TaxID=3048489 RepID=UPI0024C2F8BA|nr:hypothetical protein [Pseudoalteromonas sp. B95]MDK1286272.1 hypothetical protein [Pseudoalteromonas sp. B95]